MSLTSDAKEQIKDGAQKASAAAKDAARTAADTAKSTVRAKTEEARDGVAHEMHSTADALRRAADEVRAGSPQGSTFSYLANGLADMADSVKDQNVNDIVGMTTSFARKNPLAFLGGAALLGFAVSRYAKASTPPATPARHSAPRHPHGIRPMEVSHD